MRDISNIWKIMSEVSQNVEINITYALLPRCFRSKAGGRAVHRLYLDNLHVQWIEYLDISSRVSGRITWRIDAAYDQIPQILSVPPLGAQTALRGNDPAISLRRQTV